MTRRTSRGMTPTAAMPVPLGEPEALRLRPGVADHERRAHRRRSEDGDGLRCRADPRRRRCRGRRPPRPQRSKTESMKAPSLLTLPVARASVPSNMSKAPPMKMTSPPTSHACVASRTAPTTVIPNPMRVRPSGVSPTRPMASAIGSKTFLKRARELVGDRHDGRRLSSRRRGRGSPRSRSATSPNASGRRLQMRLAPDASASGSGRPRGGA